MGGSGQQSEAARYDKAWKAFVDASWDVDARRKQGALAPQDRARLDAASHEVDVAEAALVRAIGRAARLSSWIRRVRRALLGTE